MNYIVDEADAKIDFPEFTFIKALTPSAQKAAFHVKNADGNDLCLKLISPDYSMDRLDREIQAMQTISHENVVKLLEYTFSSKPGQRRHYLIEEFIDGSDLTTHLGSAWDKSRVVKIFGQLLDGLSALSSTRIVHRDIKPSNVRIRQDDTPVLIDFGLARHLKLSALTDTAGGAQIGTPIYFSPEQFSGNKHDIDPRTDLFAVGILLYEALVGKHPFWVSTMDRTQLQNAVCNSTNFELEPEFKSLPKRWKLIVRRMLAKDRIKRPHDAKQAATLIRKIEAM